MASTSSGCSVDANNCLSLDSILKSFHCGIKEEQAWALIFQSIVASEHFQYNPSNDDTHDYVEPKDLFITIEGDIYAKTWMATNVTLKKLWSKIALIVYSALDYGLSEDEELRLSQDLYDFFKWLDFEDEGIEAETFSLSKLRKKCCTRITDETITDIEQHYRNVCRALVAEALELSSFLRQVSIGSQELNKAGNEHNQSVDLKIEVWAQVWMKVMRELRFSYTVKKLNKVEIVDRQQKEYELSPFEMLLDDINSKRYKLKKVSDLSQKAEKDARTVILDYIKSGPRLRPAAERQLSPLPQTEPSLHQRLMEGIKSPPPLRTTPKPFERKYESFRLPRNTKFSIYTKSVVIEPPREQSTFQRLNFRNFSLRKSSFRSPPVKSSVTEEEKTNQSDNALKSFWRRLLGW